MDDNEQFSDLPANLFNGNLNLNDLSIKNNKLFQLEASQLPLERLRKLSLADNPFACNCSMIWLWQLIKSSSVVSMNELGSSNNSNNNNDMSADTGDDDESVSNNNTNNLLILDKESIGCDVTVDGADNDIKIIRKRLDEMSEADIKCPTQIVTIVSVILTVIFIAIVCVSILIFIKCSRSAQLKRRQQKYLSSERQNIGELIIPQKIDKYELERYLAEQQLQHQQKQQQIQQQYQMNNHHTIQPIHTNQNQYFQHQNSLIKPNNEYRSLKKWENGGSGGVGGVALGGGIMQHYPTLNSGSPHHHHHHSPTLKTPTATSSPLKKLHHKNNVNNMLSSYNHHKSASTLSRDDDEGMEAPQERIYATHPDDEESAVEEDHYEHFDDNYVNSLNRKINIQSTLPLTKPPSSANTVYNTNGNSKKSLHNNVKPHIVYV